MTLLILFLGFVITMGVMMHRHRDPALAIFVAMIWPMYWPYMFFRWVYMPESRRR